MYFSREQTSDESTNEFPSEFTDFLTNDTPSLPFQCTECNQSFDILNDLQLHKSTHTKDGKFVCTQCNKQFLGNNFNMC